MTDGINERTNPPSRGLFVVIFLTHMESRPAGGLERS